MVGTKQKRRGLPKARKPLHPSTQRVSDISGSNSGKDGTESDTDKEEDGDDGDDREDERRVSKKRKTVPTSVPPSVRVVVSKRVERNVPTGDNESARTAKTHATMESMSTRDTNAEVQITDAVNKRAWRDMKFVEKKVVKSYKSGLALVIMNWTNVQGPQREQWWAKYGEYARKKFKSATTSFRTFGDRRKKLLTKTRCLRWRMFYNDRKQGCVSVGGRNAFLDVSGKRHYVAMAKESKASEWCLVVNEAFIYLVLENYNGSYSQHGRYTSTAKKRNEEGTETERFSKWTMEGKLRFNHLCELVEVDRGSQMGSVVEEDLRKAQLEKHRATRKTVEEERKKAAFVPYVSNHSNWMEVGVDYTHTPGTVTKL